MPTGLGGTEKRFWGSQWCLKLESTFVDVGQDRETDREGDVKRNGESTLRERLRTEDIRQKQRKIGEPKN